MATHDYSIANQSGASFRTDLNNALAAIQSNNSNSSSPATTVAYQWWADTSAGILKIRNSSNSAWINVRELDGTTLLADGSVSEPGLCFSTDTNTGVFRSGADKINFTTGGVERLELGGETVFNEDGANVDFRIEGDADTSLLHCDAGNDRVGIGTSSPSTKLDIAGDVTITSTQPKLFLTDTNSSSDFSLQNANGNIEIVDETNSATRIRIVSNGDIGIGTSTVNRSDSGRPTIQFDYSGSDASEGCEIRLSNSAINGNASTDNAAISLIGQDFNIVNRESGNIKLFTSSAEKVRIDSGGRVGIGTSSMGSYDSGSDNFVIRSSGSTGMTISGSTGGDCQLAFSNGEDTGVEGILTYQHGSNEFLLAGIESDSTLAFRTGDDKRMIIQSSGEISIATTSKNLQGGGASDFYLNIQSNTGTNHNGIIVGGVASGHGAFTTRPSAAHQYFAGFFLDSSAGGVGSISVGTTSTTYNTSSDYRLKENAVSISDGITRLKELLPKRFNWISDDTNTLQDGFFAHEVSSIVPEAVMGEKDAVATEDGGQYAKGDPIYQQIDHSKLVPLLVAAVKELITKVEALEAA